MSRTLYTLILLAVTCLTFHSCEQVLETDIGDTAKKLVIVSNFTSNNELKVVVTSTRPFNSDAENNFVVTNAIVRVFEGTELKEELALQMSGEGEELPPTYISTDFIPQVGITYTITAEAPGYHSIQATNIIPVGTIVGDIGFSNVVNIKNTEIADVSFVLDLSFQDDPVVSNYYHILFYQQLKCFQITENGDGTLDTVTISSNDFADLNVDLVDENIPHVKYYGGQSILMKDNSFAGENVNLTIEGDFSFDLSRYIPGTFSVEIRTVSEAYYLYYTTLTSQNQSSNDVLTEPIPVFDNVENGNGIFAGYSSNTTFFAINP